MKKRILLVNEASFLSTGYSVYGYEVQKRLHATGKYELAELACYGHPYDNRQTKLPWKYYGNLPEDGSQRAEYESKQQYQWGEWKFESTCIDFKPHIVWDVRDWWMSEHEERSPFRNYFRHVLMPTVDAQPQDEQWIASYMKADAIFTYSDWAVDLLLEQSSLTINVLGAAPPGADFEAFYPIPNKKVHRESMGMEPDIFIVGTIMRNQRRKLYPDLIESFAKFLKTAPAALAKKTFLYLHTAYPDLGWRIPTLIKEAGISHKTLLTYHCEDCNAIYPAFFQDARTTCQQCGSYNACFPNSKRGIENKELGKIINLFDCYVQYANSEGFGMPQVEAGACGIPVFAVDYSAMSDVVRKLKGFPIKVQRFSREADTHCYRALPDNDDFIAQLIKFLSLPEAMKKKKGFEARKGVENHYQWDYTAKKWEKCFDDIQILPDEQTWASPAKLHHAAQECPVNLTNEQFVRWGIVNIAGRPDLLDSYLELRMVRDLNWGASPDTIGGLYFNEASTLGHKVRYRDFSRQDAVNELVMICENRNFWEQRRLG